MSKTKTKIFSIFLFLAVMILGLMPTGLKAQDACCFGDVTIGADYLYWTPCVGDMHYAIVGSEEFFEGPEEVKTKYICPDWDSGFRVYINVDDLWNGFNGGVAYTYFDADAKSSTRTNIPDSVRNSVSLPDGDNDEEVWGNEASGKWEIKYQTVDAYLSYPLNVSCNSCLEVSAFSGIKWVSYCEDRKDIVEELLAEDDGRTQTFKRNLDVCGVGPMFGVNSTYRLCDGIKAFGLMETSLIVGNSDSKDHLFVFDEDEGGEVQTDRTFKSKDDCVCFPGLHLMTGIAYETCLCDMEIALRLGWEYVQWINAPTFPFYERAQDGIRSASSDHNLTFQGIFAGLNISF